MKLNKVERPGEQTHRYPPTVHLVEDTYACTLLARLSSGETHQPDINRLLDELYRMLMRRVISGTFPTEWASCKTRMFEHVESAAEFGYKGVHHETRAALVTMARAGNRPSDACFDLLNHLLVPDGVRQDHLMMARITDADGRVTGVDISGSKIPGPVDGRVVLFADPMGATGTSLSAAVRVYKEKVGGEPLKWIAMHLIVTPEHIRRMTDEHPEVEIWAFRLDRGLSPDYILSSIPGESWDSEVGLTDNHYIVPGAGGLGEVINNADC